MLPKIEHPTYKVYLKSLNKEIRYRPFLVKEEKLLLMAKESSDIEDVIKAITQVINNCALDPLDVETLPMFDIEMFLIHLRVNSVGEIAKMSLMCNNIINEETQEECRMVIEYDLDLRKVEYANDPNHNPKVMLTDSIGMVLKYPNLEEATKIVKVINSSEDFVKEMIPTIDYLFDADQVYERQHTSETELESFLGNLDEQQIAAVKEFYITAPKVILRDNVECPKCGFVHDINMEGVEDFFE